MATNKKIITWNQEYWGYSEGLSW